MRAVSSIQVLLYIPTTLHPESKNSRRSPVAGFFCEKFEMVTTAVLSVPRFNFVWNGRRISVFSHHFWIGAAMAQDDRRDLKCTRCGERAKLVARMFDPKKGREVRLYRCRCGELLWED